MNSYNKGDGLNFPIVNFPFICSNIPIATAYGIYIYINIYQFIRYSRAYGFYYEFIDSGLLPTKKLMKLVVKMK